MDTVSLVDAKAHLSELLDRVEQGGFGGDYPAWQGGGAVVGGGGAEAAGAVDGGVSGDDAAVAGRGG